MELALFVYLAGVVGSVGVFLKLTTVFGVLGVIAYLIVIAYQVDVHDRKFSDFSSKLRNVFISVFLLGLVANLTPSEKTMYMMLAGYTAQTVVQSDTVDKVLKVVNQKLDGYLEEATKVKDK
jgi:hypothetical protein